MAKVSGPQQQGLQVRGRIWLRGEGHGKARRRFYGSRKDWMSGRVGMGSEQEVTQTGVCYLGDISTVD